MKVYNNNIVKNDATDMNCIMLFATLSRIIECCLKYAFNALINMIWESQ